MKSNNGAAPHLIRFLLIAAVIVLLIFTGVYSYLCGSQWLDSDHASEMILAKLLAEENKLLSVNWHYSTELRLVYQTIFTMPLFKLLGASGNWALIRALGIVLNNLALVLSYIFMMKQLRVKDVYIFLSAIFLLVPLSIEYWNIVTFGGYYIFFIAQGFCCLGFFAKCVFPLSPGQIENGKLPKRIALALFLVLSFMLGVQGIRAVYGFHLPLLVSCVYAAKVYSVNDYAQRKQRIFSLFTGAAGFALCCAGYGINYLLSFRYSFMPYDTMKMDDLLYNLLPKLSQCFVYFAYFFGFSAGVPLLSLRGISGIAAIAAAVLLLWALSCKARRLNLKGSHRFMSLYFTTLILVNFFVFIIADAPIISRYFFPFMIFYVPLAAILLEQAEGRLSALRHRVLACALLFFVMGQGCVNYNILAVKDINANRKGYVKYLLDNGLDYGFATFWNANVTTELSNGGIEIAGLAAGAPSGSGGRQFRILDMLLPVKFFDPLYHSGESFLLLTRDEWETARAFPNLKPDYEDGSFVIIRYPSAEVIHRDVLGN